jgi:NADPH:quinone reductase-like Zn-dependent oxidoreductase/thioesterase domain-containing protein/acyl carrier protein
LEEGALAAARDDADDLTGVIHCWSLDQPAPADLAVEQLRDAQQMGVLSAFRVVRALFDRPPRTWFVTRQVHRVVDGDRAEGLAAAPLVGLTRVANNETQCVFSLVDLGACSAEEAAEHLLAEITTAPDGERETAYRDGVRYALRLRRTTADQWPSRRFPARRDGTVTPYHLQIDRPGVLTDLALRETERRAPGPEEIEVRVMAGGLNFRDVMKALGTHPGSRLDQRRLGDDFAGTVERVGESVRAFRVGDRVAGIAPSAFSAYAVTHFQTAFKTPPGISFAEAATIPTVFLTAHYALAHLARMHAGERILVHAAAGGVGQAAIQVGRHLGLEIFATAGTPEKRRLLRDMGVRHVMSSRTLDFADEVMDATGGRGVDAVLNSLAGDFIGKSLSVLAPFGRFLEIGKVDVYRNAKIGLEGLRNNISYFVIDLAQHMRVRPALVADMLLELGERFAAGDYRPLPYTAFPVTEAADAFRFMAQAKHFGKNVLRFDVDPIPIGFDTDDARRFRRDATYLITGGSSGFGLEVARWMARHGAGHLVLMSRNGPRDASARRDIEALRAAGTTVVDARGDVTRAEDVRAVVERIRAESPPLRGVIHAAMVLDDEALSALDETRFLRVLEPKMLGAFNLHLATSSCPLEHFVCFSSFSAVAGAPRQSAYNAGNAFLDTLAHHRQAMGLPALTIDWGGISGAGFIERNQKTAEYLEKLGYRPLPIEEALDILGRLLVRDAAQVVAARTEWHALSALSTLVGSSPTYAAVARARNPEGRGSVSARLRAARSDERGRLVEDFIVDQVAAVFGIADGTLDREVPLTALGLDSLMTVELINRVEREVGLRIPMGTLLSGPNVAELATAVLRLLAPTLEAVGDDGPEAAANVDTRAAAPAAAAGHVVPLRTSGRGPALIAFHPVGGGVGIYATLARHLPDGVAVYGVESRLMRGAEREFGDLDAMVEAYVGAVREATGPPYRLFGFSLGGYLAARVAETLEGDGEPVDLVGVVEWDARPRLTLRARRDALLRVSMAAYRFLADDMGAVRPLSQTRLRTDLEPLVDRVVAGGSPRADLFHKWAVDNDLLVSDALRHWARRYLTGFGQHCAMLARARPRPGFRAPLVVWRARGGFGSALESWRHAAAVEHVIDGDHFAFFRPPGVLTLAAQLGELLGPRAGVGTLR